MLRTRTAPSRFVRSGLAVLRDEIAPTDTAAAAVPSAGNCRPEADDERADALEIDWTRCDGHGLCADLVPDRIVLDEWGFPLIRRTAVASPN